MFQAGLADGVMDEDETKLNWRTQSNFRLHLTHPQASVKIFQCR